MFDDDAAADDDVAGVDVVSGCAVVVVVAVDAVGAVWGGGCCYIRYEVVCACVCVRVYARVCVVRADAAEVA